MEGIKSRRPVEFDKGLLLDETEVDPKPTIRKLATKL